MAVLQLGELDRYIKIERPVPDETIDGAGSGEWELVGHVWAGVRDVLPSRSETLQAGINLAKRPARVRMLWRDDLSADMRFEDNGRIMQIISGPAELGHRDGLEFMVEDYSSAGNPA